MIVYLNNKKFRQRFSFSIAVSCSVCKCGFVSRLKQPLNSARHTVTGASVQYRVMPTASPWAPTNTTISLPYAGPIILVKFSPIKWKFCWYIDRLLSESVWHFLQTQIFFWGGGVFSKLCHTIIPASESSIESLLKSVKCYF